MNNPTTINDAWIGKAQERLQNHADELFASWCETKQGKRWKACRYNNRKHSPYDFGFYLPDYHHDLIEAIEQNDEKRAKGIMWLHSFQYIK